MAFTTNGRALARTGRTVTMKHGCLPAALFLVGCSVAANPAAAAEVDLDRAYFRDGIATALVIVRNDDAPRGYESLTLRCVFTRADRRVGQASAEIKDLRYRQHAAARLSTPTVDGDAFDRAECGVANATSAAE